MDDLESQSPEETYAEEIELLSESESFFKLPDERQRLNALDAIQAEIREVVREIVPFLKALREARQQMAYHHVLADAQSRKDSIGEWAEWELGTRGQQEPSVATAAVLAATVEEAKVEDALKKLRMLGKLRAELEGPTYVNVQVQPLSPI